MSKLRLTLACGDYDRTRALREGLFEVEGVDLNYVPLEPEEIFWRMEHHQEFDASEMSMGTYLIQRGRDEDRYTAIPVFPSRSFRHNSIYVHAGAGIERPEQLKGCRFGVPEYNITAAVWVRGHLQHEYGVHPSDVRWFRGGLHTPGRIEKAAGQTPAGVSIEAIPAGRTLSEMIDSGELDAMHAPRMPDSFRQGSPRVRRLFPNFREVEQAYYRKTGIFPIMHTVVIRTEIYRANRWLAESLYKAFLRSKAIAANAIYNTTALPYMLPWMIDEVEQVRSVMGDDHWAYGLEPNRATLAALTQYAHEQGLTPRQVALDELFASSTLDEFKI
jgi:4,5-dihydroxyphthalate decarboxylase